MGDRNNPQSTQIVQEALRTGIVGDFFLGPQEGGIAGGRGNINVNVAGEEHIQVRLATLQGMFEKTPNMTLADCYTSLGKLSKMKKEVTGFQKDVKELLIFFEGRRKELQERSGVTAK